MNKEEILAKSRKELKNADLAEQEAMIQSWNTAGRIGAVVCCLISAYNGFLFNNTSFSLWTVYFSMIGAKTLFNYKILRKKSDLVLGIVYAVLFVLFFAAHILKSVGVIR